MKRTTRETILVVVLAAILAACGSGAEMRPSPDSPSTLAGTAWRAVSVSGAAPVAGREPTLIFQTDQVNGSTGCNQYFGGFTYAEGAITFSQVGMTMMACDDPVGTVEAAYTKALGGTMSVTIDDGGQLLLSGPGGEILFAPEVPAAG
jgi:heat shock protein HslJ